MENPPLWQEGLVYLGSDSALRSGAWGLGTNRYLGLVLRSSSSSGT